jgi:hypothetical protein
VGVVVDEAGSLPHVAGVYARLLVGRLRAHVLLEVRARLCCRFAPPFVTS